MSQFLPSISAPLFDQDLMVRLALVLLHFLWQGALCGLAALLAGRLMPNASSSARYRVFVGILCLMAVLPAVTYWRAKGGRQATFAPAAVRPSVDTVAIAAARPAAVPRKEAAAPVRVKPISDVEWTRGASLEAVFPPRLPEPANAASPSAGRVDGVARFVVCAYFIGVLAMFARLLVALWGGRRLRCSAAPIENGPLAEIVLRQAQRIGLKAVPLIAWCTRTSVPVVVGILRPMILLPATLATGFDPVLLEALVAHELAHLRRYDPLINLAQRVIEAVLFFHPAVWYVSRRVSAERENACDDLVLLAGWPRVQYADALLQMAERSAAAQGIPSGAAAGAVLAASGGGSSQLGRRVLRLLEIGDAPRVRLSRGGVFLLATTALLIVASSPFIHAVTNKKQGSGAAQQAAPPPTAAQSATLARIFAAWQKRQEHVKSFHAVWNTRVTLPKGFEFRSYDHVSTPAELWVRNLPIVQNQTEFAMPQTEWWGQGDEHFRFDFPIVENEGASRWNQVAHVRLIRDGSIRSRLTFPSSPASKPWLTIWRTVPMKGSLPTAFAEPLRSLWRGGEGDLIPMGLALRPLSPASEWTPQNCRIESEDYVVGNVHCIKITKDTGDRAETRWVDPQRDYVVVQQAAFGSYPMVIEYHRDPQHGWIPSRWTWTILSANWLPRDTKTNLSGSAICQATVTRCAINEKFDADPFATTEPPGTQIYDVTADSSIPSSVEEHSARPPQNARAILDRIATNWLKKQTAIKSFQFTWRREWRFERKSMETWALVKPMDRTCTACGDGSLFAVELRTPGWSPLLRLPGNSLGASPRGKTAFDGIATRSFGMYGSFVSRSFGTGGSFIKTGFDPGNPSETDADDFWLAFLPSDARFTGLDPTKLRVLSDDARIGDIPCILVETGDPALSHTLLWLDPAREDVVLRKQRYAKGWNDWSVERVDFSYRGHPDNGWVPADWKKSIVGPDGTISVASTDTVTEFRINQPIPHAEFKVELPATEYVEDKDSPADREAKAREAAAAVFVERWAKPVANKPKTPPIYDPQFDALADVESALNTARATDKRVLIEFGGQGHPDCGKLYNSLRSHAELSARLRQGFELVLVDTDYPDAGQIAYKKYVPPKSRKGLPALCVLNPDGTVRHIDDTTGLKTGDDYDVDLLKAFLEKWSRRD